jgi:hypothetical protein
VLDRRRLANGREGHVRRARSRRDAHAEALRGEGLAGAHKEGHASIAQYYYKNAARYAQEVGKAHIGKSFDGTGRDKNTAQQNGYDKIVQSLEDAYNPHTRFRALAANNRFDDITRHGTLPIVEADAIAMAVATDPEV